MLTRPLAPAARYAQRRVLQGFREQAALQARAACAPQPLLASGALLAPRCSRLTRPPPQDRAAIEAALAEARQQLEMLRRQVRIPALAE